MKTALAILALLLCAFSAAADPVDPVIAWLTNHQTTINSISNASFTGTASDSLYSYSYDLSVETVVWTDLNLNLVNVAASLNGTVFQTGGLCQPCSTYLEDNWWLYEVSEGSMEMWTVGPYELWTTPNGPYLLAASDPPAGDPTSTPEPSSLALLALGLVGLGWLEKRRKSASLRQRGPILGAS